MKNLFIVFLLLITGSAGAQIQSVSLQASGLTCSMCSRAIYKSLQKVPAIGKVEEDIEHSSYHVQFSDPTKISLEALKKAVKDAGFSVAWMEINARFKNVEIGADSSIKYDDFVLHFVDVSHQTLNGEQRLLILDKDYLLEKNRKKYPGSYETRLGTDGVNKVFHVTLPQS